MEKDKTPCCQSIRRSGRMTGYSEVRKKRDISELPTIGHGIRVALSYQMLDPFADATFSSFPVTL
jgi:hypothetical protein